MEHKFGDSLKDGFLTGQNHKCQGDGELEYQEQEHDVDVWDEGAVVLYGMDVLGDGGLGGWEVEVETVEVFPAEQWTQVQVNIGVIGEVEEGELENPKQLQAHNLNTEKRQKEDDVAGHPDEYAEVLQMLVRFALLLRVLQFRDTNSLYFTHCTTFTWQAIKT